MMRPDSGVLEPAAVPERLVDQAYRRLRDAIVSVQLQPGAPLDERGLSSSLGLGLTPVRDALKRLTLERLAVTYPRRGTFVTEINIADETLLTEVRVELEGLAATLAAERATPAESAAMERMLINLERPGTSVAEHVALDARVHRAIYSAARNPFLQTALNQYANLAMRIWNFGLQGQRETVEHACSQRAVVEAIVDGDPFRARMAAQDHLRGFSDEMRSMVAGPR